MAISAAVWAHGKRYTPGAIQGHLKVFEDTLRRLHILYAVEASSKSLEPFDTHGRHQEGSKVGKRVEPFNAFEDSRAIQRLPFDLLRESIGRPLQAVGDPRESRGPLEIFQHI